MTSFVFFKISTGGCICPWSSVDFLCVSVQPKCSLPLPYCRKYLHSTAPQTASQTHSLQCDVQILLPTKLFWMNGLLLWRNSEPVWVKHEPGWIRESAWFSNGPTSLDQQRTSLVQQRTTMDHQRSSLVQQGVRLSQLWNRLGQPRTSLMILQGVNLVQQRASLD